MIIVNLYEVTENGTNLFLSGKKKGLAAREFLKIELVDNQDEPVEIIVPENLECNESYLGGLFSRSITKAGSRAAFLSKFQFSILPKIFQDRLNKVITATLSTGTALSSMGSKK